MSAFESGFYALHFVGSILDSSHCRHDSPETLRRITPASVAKSFGNAFPDEPWLGALQRLANDERYVAFSEVRNKLLHRAAPGRASSIANTDTHLSRFAWKLNNARLSANYVDDIEHDFTCLMDDLMATFAAICAAKNRAHASGE